MNSRDIKTGVRVLVGKDAYKKYPGDNGYEGMKGTIFYCRTCCNAHRIQFENIGNNERVKNFYLRKLTKII
jgi:hypothetical protein